MYRVSDTVGAPVVQGVVGLLNLGNTSFMNAVIQCLCQSPWLKDYFYNDYFIKDINICNPLGYNGDIVDEFAALIKLMFSNKYKVIGPYSFRNTITFYNPKYAGYQMHDTWEFMLFLIDGLHEELNLRYNKPYIESLTFDGSNEYNNNERKQKEIEFANKCYASHSLRNKRMIEDLFSMQIRSQNICPVCNKNVITFDISNCISLALPNIIEDTNNDKNKNKNTNNNNYNYNKKENSNQKNIDIDELFQLLIKKHTLNESDPWYCTQCKEFQLAEHKKDIWNLPNLLILHLNRFKYKYTR